MRSSAATLVALLALAACEKSAEEEPAASAEPAREVREVAAADDYGEPGEGVNAVAFWSHPSVNFQSLLIAATDAGLRAYSIEDGAQVASTNGATSAAEVFYLGAGAAAQGYLIARAGGAYELYSIDNDAPAFTPLALNDATPGADAFCVNGNVLYEAAEDRLAARDVTIASGDAEIGEAKDIAAVPGIVACHADVRSGAIITISKDGAIRRVDPKTGESFGLVFVADANVNASTLFLMTTPEPENAPGGAIATLDGASGVISLYDLIDGRALGAIRIKSTFDLDAVASAKAIASGYGNYGGVYRDGALAVVTSGEGAPIRLAPWNGVLDALKLALGENVDPRSPQAEAVKEPILDIEFEQP